MSDRSAENVRVLKDFGEWFAMRKAFELLFLTWIGLLVPAIVSQVPSELIVCSLPAGAILIVVVWLSIHALRLFALAAKAVFVGIGRATARILRFVFVTLILLLWRIPLWILSGSTGFIGTQAAPFVGYLPWRWGKFVETWILNRWYRRALAAIDRSPLLAEEKERARGAKRNLYGNKMQEIWK